jgi:DHA2 family multidrug resistance protein-like MFS transporter
MIALVSLTYALMEVAKPAPDSAHAGIALLSGIIFMAWFVVRQKLSTSPTVDFALFRSSGFLGGILAIIAGMVALIGVQLMLLQRLQLVLGFSPLQAALFIIPMSLASFVSGPLLGAVLLRLGVERGIAITLLIGAAGLTGLAYFEHSAFALQLASLIMFGVGGGASASAASTAIMINAPDEKAGMAASIEGVSFELGGVIGIAIMGSIATYLYSSSIVLPHDFINADRARDSLDQALLLAGQLNAQAANQLVAHAKTAFDLAYLGVMLAGAAIMGVLGVVFVLFMKPSKASDLGARQH